MPQIGPVPQNVGAESTDVGASGMAHAEAYYPSYAEAVNKDTPGGVGVGGVGQPVGDNPVDAVAQDDVAVAQSQADDVVKAASSASSGVSAESSSAIQKLNPASWPSSPRMAKFYVIKSFGEDDVHKSIKYNLWCSTERGNRKLDEAFAESKRLCERASLMSNGRQIDSRDTQHGCPVYLFFSVNRSGCFCGMAQMISSYYAERHFGSWVQDGKWQGSFIVKWIYVKDIPNKDLKDITLANNDGRPVTFSRDTQEIPFAQGVTMLRRFIEYKPKTNILQDFQYYDDRERDIKHKRTQLLTSGQGGPGQHGQHGGPQGGGPSGPHQGHFRGGGRGRGYHRGGGGYGHGRERHNYGRDRDRGMNGTHKQHRGHGHMNGAGGGGPEMQGKDARDQRYGGYQILKRNQNQSNHGHGRGRGRGRGASSHGRGPRGPMSGMVAVDGGQGGSAGGGQANGAMAGPSAGGKGAEMELESDKARYKARNQRNRWVPK